MQGVVPASFAPGFLHVQEPMAGQEGKRLSLDAIALKICQKACGCRENPIQRHTKGPCSHARLLRSALTIGATSRGLEAGQPRPFFAPASFGPGRTDLCHVGETRTRDYWPTVPATRTFSPKYSLIVSSGTILFRVSTCPPVIFHQGEPTQWDQADRLDARSGPKTSRTFCTVAFISSLPLSRTTLEYSVTSQPL